jgi:hypothetical protein
MEASRLGLLAALIASAAPAPSLAQSATGTWQWSGRNESGMLLKTTQAGNRVHFQLEVSRGAPSYNSGYAEGEFQLRGASGTFSSKECEINFTFRSKRVQVSQSIEKGGCGFGGSVHANGFLSLRSSQAPKFSQGDPRVSKP